MLQNYLHPKLDCWLTHRNRQWTGNVLSRAADVLTNIQNAPQTLSPAIGFSTFNLRPFQLPVATPAVSIGLIYLLIISFFAFTFYLPIHMQFVMPGHRPLKFLQLCIWRWCATVTAYFLLSLIYSFISLAFQIPFSARPALDTSVANSANAYHYGSFVVYWMLNWMGMLALGMASENVAMIVGIPWVAFWLIFWVITNVSTSFYSLELAPAFYR